MAGQSSQNLQDILEAAESSRANDIDAGTPASTSITDSDYMDYEVGTEEDGDEISDEAILERLLAEREIDIDEDEDEDEEEGFDSTFGEIQVEIEEEPSTTDGNETETERSEQFPEYTLTLFQIIILILGSAAARQRRQVMRLLANSEIGRLFHFGNVDDDDDDEELDDDEEIDEGMWRRRRRRARPDPNRFPKVPSDKGSELMNSGTFGSNEVQTVKTEDTNRISKRKKLARRILDREMATESYAKQKVNQRLMAQGMIPSSNADVIIHYNQPVYSGQFSDDGNFFFSANKDYRVRMYDTSNPYKWRYYKTVEYPFGQWTLTDATLSPDNRYLAYTSIRSTVCLAPTDPNDRGDPYNLDLSDMGDGRNNNLGHRARFGGSFGIWSIRFSGDGRRLVAGATGGSIVVYDIESRRSLHRIFGHDEDVNAVCFADSSSPHILYSGSDDTTLKVWDTRSMGDSREAGAFVGHIEGLTYIDSKGDGRYILSNGKDQSMKLWDLRMVMSPRDFNALQPNRRRATEPHFDYRWGTYDDDDWYVHPNDNSIVTYRGHKVLRTLIRCHFSPPGSTNSRYVYSGSEDGKVYIWNMDATPAGVVDVYGATKNSRPPHSEYDMRNGWDDDEDSSHSRWKTCVRDASWHPNAPMIVASAWSGYSMSTGTCTVHSWNDGAEEDEAEPKMGLRVNQKLEMDPALYASPPRERPVRRSLRTLRGLRAVLPGADDDDE